MNVITIIIFSNNDHTYHAYHDCHDCGTDYTPCSSCLFFNFRMIMLTTTIVIFVTIVVVFVVDASLAVPGVTSCLVVPDYFVLKTNL